MLNIPSHRTTLTHEERDSVKTAINGVPGLTTALSELAGGDRRVRNHVVTLLAHGIAHTPTAEITPDFVRTLVGAPAEASRLGEWRTSLISRNQEASLRPSRPESF